MRLLERAWRNESEEEMREWNAEMERKVSRWDHFGGGNEYALLEEDELTDEMIFEMEIGMIG